MRAGGLFSRTRRGSVSAQGEKALIGLIRRWLGPASPPSPAGIGDDCAVLAPARGRELLTVDPVVHGIHFDDSAPAAAAGAKLFRRNLSDIAAMGGQPRAAVVALALDGRVSLRWLAGFFRGLRRESLRHGVPVVGGDVAALPGAFVATLALSGEARGRVLTRAGARLGDRIYVTGRLGASLSSGRHLSFEPRLAEGAWLAAQGAVHSMMDLSDGLAKDLPALVPAGAEPSLAGARIPLRRGATLRGALCDGEDYELAFCASPGAGPRLEAAFRRRFPRTRLTCIGSLVRRGQAPRGSVRLDRFAGYEHLR
jgi:thiamine-monophosphate kinase